MELTSPRKLFVSERKSAREGGSRDSRAGIIVTVREVLNIAARHTSSCVNGVRRSVAEMSSSKHVDRYILGY